ncbi:hypothetical protein YH65_04960 [Sulfurovum lithotrophicum]|uniref:L,D-TPase catalytic domain-containing protein n=1 Tax=Sulfurovum lithotrophicum TaxID=206403 RepID=A0A7U4RQJ3_9BACT|nr:L,D-transpeptidase family protein [Sulfurovum lithotrophicum]AKF24806.1 hypothetical protein YH65_04960 [Sulfurovum lithotrophicum]
MILTRLLFTVLVLFSAAHAKHSFKHYNDICEKTDNQKCVNDPLQVKNLQIALNADKYLHLHLKTDGKWGKNTKEAVQKFQKHYHIFPAEGYVGAKTKRVLERVAKNVKLPPVRTAAANKMTNRSYTCYADFKKHVDLQKSYKVFKNNKLLSKANGKNTHIKIDVSEQRLKLYVNGKVALCAPCTTGAKRKFEPNTKTYRDKHTPLGTFRIKEKIAAKKSTIFGEMYRNGKKVYHGDRRKYRGPRAKYVGHTMHHWMRLTSGGVGLHASKYIKRHPGSNGCVRLPFKVASIVFSKVKKGTKVSVIN